MLRTQVTVAFHDPAGFHARIEQAGPAQQHATQLRAQRAHAVGRKAEDRIAEIAFALAYIATQTVPVLRRPNGRRLQPTVEPGEPMRHPAQVIRCCPAFFQNPVQHEVGGKTAHPDQPVGNGARPAEPEGPGVIGHERDEA